ncbi:MAG: putative toxin-antitoxin system toxin component, PIN family [Vicinamibacteria bacterium]
MARERVVIDTNVFVSGLLISTSVPARVVNLAVRDHQLLVSSDTLRELARILLAPRFDKYVSRDKRTDLIARLAPIVEVVEIVQTVQASRDPRDDKFLEVAVNGGADTIVSGDDDLLVLHSFRGIAILRPADSLIRWE